MSIKRVLRNVTSVGAVGVFLVALAGCRSTGNAYLQTTRDNQPHASRNRIASPDDYRVHERHASGIESQVADY
jgi:hypothetical protein